MILRQMKTFLITIQFVLLYNMASAQIFFSEEFNNPPCNTGCPATGFINPAGPWTLTDVGVNGPTPNEWFVSCAENGAFVGDCGTGCVGLGDATLHIASTINQVFAGIVCPTGDCGAAYYAGFPPLDDVTTNKRIESPTIDCSSALCAPTIRFKYIFNGEPPFDYFMLEYFDGVTWNILDNPAQTTICPNGQGRWTLYTLPLPASAIANANVKIGFRWINNNDGSGADPSVAIDSIVVGAPSLPDVQFTVGDNTVCTGSTTTITLNNPQPGLTYSWDYNNTQTYTGTTPPDFDSNLGTTGDYEIFLTADDGCGQQTASQIITVNDCNTINAVIGLTATDLCINDAIDFFDLSTGNITSWSWTFNGSQTGSSSLEDPAQIVFDTIGLHEVILIVSDGVVSDTDTVLINVYYCLPPPDAAFIVNFNPPVCIDSCVTITNTSNYLPGATFSWTFESGIPSTANTADPPEICFNSAGSFEFKLVITNPDGQMDSVTADFIVLDCQPPQASFTPNTAALICVDSCMTFNNTSTASVNATYEWTFPGGTPNNFIGANPPDICYATIGGPYVAKLKVTDFGLSDSTTLDITVQDCPTLDALFTASVINICPGDSILFTDQSTGAVSWDWTFAGGTPSTFSGQAPPYITYDAPGTYTAQLIITNSSGNDQYTLDIIVDNCGAPIPAFSASQTVICAGDCIQFFDESTSNPQGWYWNFPGGSPSFSTQENPPYICYDAPGVYPVSLRVFNNLGIDSITIQGYIIVNASSQVATTFDSTTILLGESVTLGAFGGVSYTWYPDFFLSDDSVASPVATPLDTTLYSVVMTDLNGCTSTAQVLVNVRPPNQVFVPNIFSPNSDAVNDFIKLYTTGPIERLEFHIFDRWGNRVFFSDDVNERWDGTYNGKNCNTGVYAYFYRIAFADGKVIRGKGDITLIR